MTIQINHRDIANRKAAILTKLSEITISEAQREDLEIQTLPDVMDAIQWQTARDIAVVQLDHQAKLARELRDALGRIEDGSYGVCEDCENPIAPRRLDVMPFARLCVRCQERHEAHRHDEDFAFEEAA